MGRRGVAGALLWTQQGWPCRANWQPGSCKTAASFASTSCLASVLHPPTQGRSVLSLHLQPELQAGSASPCSSPWMELTGPCSVCCMGAENKACEYWGCHHWDLQGTGLSGASFNANSGPPVPACWFHMEAIGQVVYHGTGMLRLALDVCLVGIFCPHLPWGDIRAQRGQPVQH